MKKLKQLVSAAIAAVALFGTQAITADAETQVHQVKSGESLYVIGKSYGASIKDLQRANNEYDNMLYVGQKLVVPQTASAYEKDLLAKLVEAEAKGEPYAGKVAVATVVLNRVDSDLFPDTIRGVIYERSPGGYYAFSPVQNGAINQPASSASKRAVNEAIALRGTGKGSLYFYNPRTAESDWIFSKQVTAVIGNHRFAK